MRNEKMVCSGRQLQLFKISETVITVSRENFLSWLW